jgi:hypothetical protein
MLKVPSENATLLEREEIQSLPTDVEEREKVNKRPDLGSDIETGKHLHNPNHFVIHRGGGSKGNGSPSV